jgi:hypothetical protein
LARSAVSLPHQRNKETSGDLEGGRQPPVPNPDLGNSSFFRVRIMHRGSMQFKGSFVGPL